MTNTENTTDRETILNALAQWIQQKPGLDRRDYGDMRDANSRSAYNDDSYKITRQLRDAKILLAAVRDSSITAEELEATFPRAYAGRLEWNGKELEYTTGQYWPTEYRAAACAVLAAALWAHHRDEYTAAAKGKESPGDAIRRKFRNRFGRDIQSRWFD